MKMKISIIPYMAFTFYMLSQIITSMLNLFLSPSAYRDILFSTILITPLIFSLIYIIRYKNILSYLDIFLIIPIVYFIFKVYQPSDSNNFLFYTEMMTKTLMINMGIFGYIYIRLLNDISKLGKNLVFIALIMFLYQFWRPIEYFKYGYWTSIVNGDVTQLSYSLEFSYLMLIPTLIFLYAFFEKFKYKFIYLILSLVGIFEIFIFGSRTVFLSAFLFIIIYILTFKMDKVSQNKKIFYSLMTIFVVIIITAFYQEILIGIKNILLLFNIESRNLNSLITGTIFNDSPREYLWSKAIELISNGDFLGYGPFGDYILIGIYSHNIILEILISFGISLGIALILIYMYILFKIWFSKYIEKSEKKVLLIFIIMAFPKLLVTNTFWLDLGFWLLSGLLITLTSKIKNRKRRIQYHA